MYQFRACEITEYSDAWSFLARDGYFTLVTDEIGAMSMNVFFLIAWKSVTPRTEPVASPDEIMDALEEKSPSGAMNQCCQRWLSYAK